MGKYTLPQVNDLKFYEIRIESIGGLGANLAGKMLADAGMIGMGFNGASFASYGSEKKGTPVKAFVRFCAPDVKVRINQYVAEPHILVLFHENLMKWLPVTQGVKPDAKIVVNTNKSPKEIREMMKLHGGTIYCIDAIKISVEEKVKINTILLGAITHASGFLDKEKVKDVIRSTFESKYPALVEPNLKGFERGFNEVVVEQFSPDARYQQLAYEDGQSKLGYKSQPIGGILPVVANNVTKNMSTNRVGYIPLWHEDRCIHCAQCDLICPDMCFKWEEETRDGKTNMFLKGIDYQYCKGCLKCIKVCPKNALTKEIEADYDVEKLTVQKYRV